MITKFKIYESISQKLKVDDFVICKYWSNFPGDNYAKIVGFISNNIGVLRKIDGDMVKVEYFPTSIEDKKALRKFRKEQGFDNPKAKYNFSPDNYLIFDLNEVEYWSDNKEELEMMINSKKYKILFNR